MKTIRSLLLVFFLCILSSEAVFAQSDELTLLVNKRFGFDAGSQINGTFELRVEDTGNLSSVQFMIDGELLANVTQAPFEAKLVTNDYSSGWHELSAQATTLDGATLVSKVRRFDFLSADQESAAMGKIILPIGGVVIVVLLVILLSQLAAFRPGQRRKVFSGAPHTYGLRGGAVCPKCRRPFAMHWWGINLLGGHYDRCDYCGRSSIMHRASAAELEQAAQAALQDALPTIPTPVNQAEEDLRQMLDDSKFTD